MTISKIHFEKYKSKLNKHSRELVENDGIILKKFLLNIHDGLFYLSLIPYCALYVRSAQELFNAEILDSNINKEIQDIRNGLKIFTGRYSKGKRMACESDRQQDVTFKKMIRLSILQKYNIHYNLGVYFNSNGRVVYNTQLANYFLNVISTNGLSKAEQAKALGYKLGRKIEEVLNKYCEANETESNYYMLKRIPKYGYIDFNTNRKNGFFNTQIDKDTNLIFLHMLSMMGFVNNLLLPIIPKENLWLSRVLYITTHNTWLGIKKIKRHFEPITSGYIKTLEMDELIRKGDSYFSSSFRNCMMHYNLVHKGKPVVKEKYYDVSKPFYGLIESCFEGMDFQNYYRNLCEYAQELEYFLLSQFYIDQKKIKWD